MLKSIILIVLYGLLSSLSLLGADHYIRQSASGDGSDWANACGDFSGSCAVSSLVRGDTYYVADGTYSARTWNTADSGTLAITIRKATVANHGTATGWSDAYGDGQAVFSGSNQIESGYWDFNGVSEYGFKIDFSEGQGGLGVIGATGVTLRYIDFDGIAATGNYNYSAGTKGIVIGRGVVNFLVSHCTVHGGESLIQEGDGIGNGADSTGTIVEYSHFYNSRSSAPAFHSNVYFSTGSANGTFRYNLIHDYNDEGLFFTGWEGGPTGWKVYGNVFWSDGGETNPRGIEIRQDYSYSGIEIYHNTFVNLGIGGILNRAPETGNICTSCVAKNNLSYNSPNTLSGMTASNNTADSINRFVDLGAKNFRLSAPHAGESLAATYNTDLTGRTRGLDGAWDIGAYEFAPPTTLRGTVRGATIK